MSQSYASSRSGSLSHVVEYTPQHFLTYLQSIKTFKSFDQSTLILQSQPPNKDSSLNIRITEHQHIGLHDFITDCILLSRIHSDPQYKSTVTHQTQSSILSMHHVTPLLSKSKSNRSFLLSFYNQFFHFLSILTQLFDEKIVSTKLRIRGPFLLMQDKPCMKLLCSFLLSQITIIQCSMNLRSDGRYEMHLKQMKNLRYILHLIKNLLQFELFTFDFLQFEVVSNMILFCQNDGKEWSTSLSKLFDVVLMIQLPTHSVGILSKFTVDKLILLETKAILTTKAFRSFVITFIRFLVIHYHQTIIENNVISLPFNHLDVIMNELFQLTHHTKDIMCELWSVEKLETEFKTEYETKHKYESSAFLKGSMIGTDEDNSSIHTEEWSANSINLIDTTSLTPKTSGKKRKRIEFEDTMDITNHTVGNEKKYKQFITEQCYVLIIDKILPFCMDFDGFYRIITVNTYAMHDAIIVTLNDILLHFIKNEKWWQLSHIMSLYNALFEDENIFKHFIECVQSENDMACNIRHGIYSFLIWICYLHQLTPKPVICFFDDDFDADKALRDVDGTTKRDKLLNKTNAKIAGFECLESVQLRITELLLSKAVLIKLMITTGKEWLIEDMMCNFVHIRDRYVLVKLLMLLLQDIEHLELSHVLEDDESYLQRFIGVFHQFKREIVCNQSSVSNEDNDSLSHIPKHTKHSKSKIMFRKQPLSIHLRRKRTDNIKKESASANQVDDIKRDSENKPIFEHFASHSMKIVDCIVNNTKHLLHQFVTTPPSRKHTKQSTKQKESVTQSPVHRMPEPPVFEERREANVSLDLSFLTSTLSSIQNVLDVPQNEEKDQKKKKQREEDDFDFDFDFQRIANKRKKPVPPSPTQGMMFSEGMAPPQKKRKIAAQPQNNDNNNNSGQLTDLLSFLCATPEKSNTNTNKKDTISPRYPRPKAPTMRELDDADDDSNWTNVVNFNRY